jgi:predicted secreted hydrolase
MATIFHRGLAIAFLGGMAALLVGCGMPGMVPPGKALAPPSPTATAAPLPLIRFPQDDAPHKNLTEWWYYTGHIAGIDNAGQQHAYGFELTFFQILHDGITSVNAPLYIGHYAISDLTRGVFLYDQRLQVETNTVLPNGTSMTGFDLAIADWTMRGLDGHDTLAAAMTNYAIGLTLQSDKPPAQHGANGIIQLGILGFSYYYSRTHMDVTGAITDHGMVIPVTGLAWMDHQWGDFIATGGGGWDWFNVQINNDTEYMIYFLRDTTGTIIQAVGTEIDPRGKTTDLTGAQITHTATGHWQSPATAFDYPSGWSLTLPTGTLTITPELRDQELVTIQTTGNVYWEGACQISGTINGHSIIGQGYTELTGIR